MDSKTRSSFLKDLKKSCFFWGVVILVVGLILALIYYFCNKEYSKIISYEKTEATISASFKEYYINPSGNKSYHYVTEFSYVIDGEKYENKIDGDDNYKNKTAIIYVNPQNYKECHFENDVVRLKQLPGVLASIAILFIVIFVAFNTLYIYHDHMKKQRRRRKKASTLVSKK